MSFNYLIFFYLFWSLKSALCAPKKKNFRWCLLITWFFFFVWARCEPPGGGTIFLKRAKSSPPSFRLPVGDFLPSSELPGSDFLPGFRLPVGDFLPSSELPGSDFIPSSELPGSSFIPSFQLTLRIAPPPTASVRWRGVGCVGWCGVGCVGYVSNGCQIYRKRTT